MNQKLSGFLVIATGIMAGVLCFGCTTPSTDSTNADLSAITLDSGTLSPAFAASTTAYTVDVTSTVTSVTVVGTKADEKASVSPAVTLKDLVVGVTQIATITVTAQSGATKDYTVAVTRFTGAMVGVSMPTQGLQRWKQDGANIKSLFNKAGYPVDIQYANNDVPTQVVQIKNMIGGGCKVLVIGAINGSSLTEVLKDAKARKIPVIAYDRLIMNSDAVSYYATFDNYKVGVMQGEYLRDQLKLTTASGPFNMELITGDSEDNNAKFFFNGALSILKPFIDSGKIVIKSGQTSFAQCATKNWSTTNAKDRFTQLIQDEGYGTGPTGVKLDAVLASNDSTAQGVTNALVVAGYTKDNFPFLTGQDCDRVSVKNIRLGLQSMSVFKDTRTLAAKVVEMADAYLKGKTVPVTDTKTYYNGTGVIPSYLCDSVSVTVDNYKEMLIDSGYYTEADLAVK